jgi:branched-subunit amino acid transport protein
MSWLLIVAVAAVTFGTRFVFIATLKPHSLPHAVRTALGHVAPAVLAAIVVPQILYRGDVLDAGLDNPRVLAAVAAFAIAWFTRSILGTIAGGMSVLWLAQWLLGP